MAEAGPDRDAVVALLREHEAMLRAMGVQHLAIFGSRARGDHTRESDIDMLIDVVDTSRFSLLDLVGVERIVTDRTGIASNAIMRRSLDSDFRAAITADVVEVF
jgi:predicted nucleotidyltransferase